MAERINALVKIMYFLLFTKTLQSTNFHQPAQTLNRKVAHIREPHTAFGLTYWPLLLSNQIDSKILRLEKLHIHNTLLSIPVSF